VRRDQAATRRICSPHSSCVNSRRDSAPEAAIAEYLSVLGNEAALEAALAWYRAAGALTRVEVGAITVPTLYLWGDQDSTVGRSAAESTADFVTGPFRFEVIRGAGHFITDQQPARVTELLLDHVRRHPAGARSTTSTSG